MERKFEASEQNFTEGKSVHYLCSVQSEREVMVLNFFNLVLKRY